VILSKDKELRRGLYHFQVIVRVRLDEKIYEKTEDGEPLEPSQGYYCTFGVTEGSIALAAALVEDELWKRVPVGGSEDPFGSIEAIEVHLLAPGEVECKGDAWKNSVGIHWESGRAYFADTDEDELM
jgi:hypothetical protein